MDATKETVNLASPIELRQRLAPFTKDESGIQYIANNIKSDNNLSRAGLYCLNIITNLIKQNVTEVFKRTPQKTFRGLSESDRKITSGAVILRAGLDRRNGQESRNSHAEDEGRRGSEILESGYTKEQELLGKWAERDGCWSDSPETDQIRAGRQHREKNDGSESTIYSDREKANVYKLKGASHYENSVQKLLDATITHNAIFPETKYEAHGYGQREVIEDNEGFIFVLSQPYVKGRVPEGGEIKDLMEDMGFVRYGNHYISTVDGLIVRDVNQANSLVTKDGDGNEYLAVFDCDAEVKTGRTPGLDQVDVVRTEDLKPVEGRGDGYQTEAWDKVLGKRVNAFTSKEVKSSIRKSLAFNGRAVLPNGKLIIYKDPQKKPIDENTVREYHLKQNFMYVAKEAEIGFPCAFYENEGYKIPDVQFSKDRIDKIRTEILKTLPEEMTLYDFLRNPKFIGNAADWSEGKEERQLLVNELKATGHISGLLEGKYVVALDRDNPDNILISTPEKIQFLMFSTSPELLEDGEKIKLTQMERNRLIMGETLHKQGREIFFDIDRGRIEARTDRQRKLEMKDVQVNINKKQDTVKKGKGLQKGLY